MPLFKLCIRVVDLDAGRSVSGLLGEVVEPSALAVTLFEDEAAAFVVEAYYEQEPSAPDIDRALSGLGTRVGGATIETVPDANWVAISQAALPPILAGRFIVHGSHDRSRVGLRPLAIEIEAGEAFGTGHNATTSGCLEAIDALTRRRRFARVLDLGCGTGVLAIAAARILPRARVVASDNDPVANRIATNALTSTASKRVRVTARLHAPALRRPHRSTWWWPTSCRAPDRAAPRSAVRRHAATRRRRASCSGLLSSPSAPGARQYRAAGTTCFARRRTPAARCSCWAALTLRCRMVAAAIMHLETCRRPTWRTSINQEHHEGHAIE
jgi:ribosomal protein L11 methyltransferase